MASEADSAITTTPDFTILKDLVRSHFLQTLQEIPGEKLLMLDPEVSPFFRVMVGKAEKGLIKDTILLEPDCIIDVETPVVVFALKPSVPLLKTIVKLITETESDKRFLAFFCPRYTSLCKQVFEEGKIIKSITVHEFPYELIPLERDVLTLDDNNGFNNLIMGKDYTSLQWVKHSLNRLEALCGRIPIKYAKGPWSCIVHDSLLSNKEKDQGNSDSDIDALILLDRTVDLFTPLVTQMTYEGIIDEFYGIKCGSIEVDRKVLDPDAKDVKENEKKTLCLTSQEDIFFGESRDKNFNIMKEFFPKKYEEMKSLCEKKDAFKTLAEMTEYIKQLRGLKIPQLQAFYNLNFNMLAHLDTLVIKHNFKQMVSMEPKVILADTLPKEVIDFLELEIAKCEEKERLLRLLCLLSLTNNGLPKDAYNLLMKEFIDAFGIAELMRVLNLEKVGLLKKKESGGLQWGLIKTYFQLIVEDVNVVEPNDIAYAYNGYAPLSARLIEKLLQTGWSIPEIDKIPGPKRVPVNELGKLQALIAQPRPDGKKRTILVYFIGGVTYAEISCFRYLSAKTGIQFIVGTTQFINGNKLVDSFKDEQGNLLRPESLIESS